MCIIKEILLWNLIVLDYDGIVFKCEMRIRKINEVKEIEFKEICLVLFNVWFFFFKLDFGIVKWW